MGRDNEVQKVEVRRRPGSNILGYTIGNGKFVPDYSGSVKKNIFGQIGGYVLISHLEEEPVGQSLDELV